LGGTLTIINNISFGNIIAGNLARYYTFYLPNDLVVNDLDFSYGYSPSGGGGNSMSVNNYSITVTNDITMRRIATTASPSFPTGLAGNTIIIWNPKEEGELRDVTGSNGSNLTGILSKLILFYGKSYLFRSQYFSIMGNCEVYSNGNTKFRGILALSYNTIFKCSNGQVDASACDLYLWNQSGSATLLDIHKIGFNNVTIRFGTTTYMNEFFSGTPTKTTRVAWSGPNANPIISFTDNKEKIAKFVDVSNCTIARRLQLILITKNKNPKNFATNNGIRYINQSPNGFPKNEPSVLNTIGYGTMGYVSDPIYN